MTIDPRLVERRKNVAEGNAHRNVGRLLGFLVFFVVAAAFAWLLFSPLLSVSQVRTAGIVSSDAHAILVDHTVVAGTPMIMVRADDVEQALETDPWIARARVHLSWPNEVVVRVTERKPVIWVESGEGWSWRAVDGIAVPASDQPDQAGTRLLVPHLAEADLEDSQLVRGAAEFANSLRPEVAEGAILRVDSNELWGDVAGFDVRLGRPTEMAAKALSLNALLAENLPEDATLILVAPTHPAVEVPGATSSETDREAEEPANGDEGSDQ